MYIIFQGDCNMICVHEGSKSPTKLNIKNVYSYGETNLTID